MPPKPFDAAYEARVLAAKADVSKGMTLYAAAKLHQVSRGAVAHRISGGNARRGGPTDLTLDEEELLVEWLMQCSRRGFPRRKHDVLLSVKEFFDKNPNRQTRFVDNMPGNKWYYGFLKRHSGRLSLRTPEAISTASGTVSENDIRKWFESVRELLVEENAADALDDPERVGNADETAFRLCPSKSYVLAEKGCKDIYEIQPADPKFAITAMFGFTAAGKSFSPMLIFPYQRIPIEISNSIPKNWGIGRSENGWMTAETFYEWIGNVVSPFLTQNNIKLPFVLFVDGHSTHLTRETSQLCKDLQIELIALYPNATHILQPCDVAAFRPLKAAWSKALIEWRKGNPHCALRKEHIGPILEIALQKDLSEAVKNGFRATGLHPFNADAVNYDKCKGHNSQANEENPTAPPKTITLSDFNSLVGDQVLQELASNQNSPARDALRRIQEALGGDNMVAPVPGGEEGEQSQPLIQQQVHHTPPHDDNPDDPDSQAGPSTSAASAGGTSLRDVVMWPHSPKRKGKRQSERLPFVVTSQRWREIQEKKEKDKAAAVAAVEDRKRARLEKKAEKDAEKAQKQAERAQRDAEMAQNVSNTTSKTPARKGAATRQSRRKK